MLTLMRLGGLVRLGVTFNPVFVSSTGIRSTT